MVWLLLACAPGDVADPDDSMTFLGDVSEIPERTRLSSYGVASLTEDGPDLEDPTFQEAWRRDELVVVDAADRVRVHWEDREIELLLWLDRPDLVDVLDGRTWGRGASEETGAEFPAGLAVDWEDGRPVAEIGGLWLHARVAVPNAAVDQVYVPSDDPAEVEGAYLSAGIEILDVPGGRPVAETVAHDFEGYLVPARVLREERGWTLVEAVDRALRVRGWVPSDDVSDHADLGVGGSSCGCCGWSSRGIVDWIGPHVTLPASTLLRSGGSVVGRVTEAVTVPGELVGGEVTFPRYTPWGSARLTASPADVLPIAEPEWTDES